MKKLLTSKKGVLGLDTVKVVIISILTIAVVAIAAVLALTALGNTGVFRGTTLGGLGDNLTNVTLNTTAYGLTQFFNQVPTIFVLLAVVVLILIISIVIVAVSRFGGGSRESL